MKTRLEKEKVYIVYCCLEEATAFKLNLRLIHNFIHSKTNVKGYHGNLGGQSSRSHFSPDKTPQFYTRIIDNRFVSLHFIIMEPPSRLLGRPAISTVLNVSIIINWPLLHNDKVNSVFQLWLDKTRSGRTKTNGENDNNSNKPSQVSLITWREC